MRVPRVLIIDDDEGSRLSLSGLLRVEGFLAETAATGDEGIKSAIGNPADLLLVDLNLPDMSGIDVALALKAKRVQAPIVVMTAFPELDASRDAAALEGVRYVEGPLLFEELFGVICDELSRTEPQGPTPPGTPAECKVPTRPLPLDPRLRRVTRAIEAELSSPWSVRGLAAEQRLSESRLRHLFSQVFGMSLRRFIRHQRLQKAAQLLLTTSASLQSIAVTLRLPDDLRGVRCLFRKRFGMSPREYRFRYRLPAGVSLSQPKAPLSQPKSRLSEASVGDTIPARNSGLLKSRGPRHGTTARQV